MPLVWIVWISARRAQEILPPTDLTDLHGYAEYVEDNTDNK